VLPDGVSPPGITHPSTETWGSASLARADREFRTLVEELGGDAPALEHIGLDLDGVTEAAQARSERLFWVVSNPNQYPGPSTHAAVAGAWFHGAVCAGVVRTWEVPPPSRLVGTADLMASVKTYEAECEETGNSKAALARLGMVRGILQPAFGTLAPDRAVDAVCSETGMPSEVSRDCLGLFAIDGAAVACNALERVASDPGPPPADIAAALASYRLQRAAVELTEDEPAQSHGSPR
jgi:hypothetical protein